MTAQILRRFVFSLALLYACTHVARAQCDYQLNMYDSFGDGWNGGILTIISGADVYQFELFNDPPGNAFTSTAFFTVTDGAPLLINWAPGGFNFEVSFEIFDSQGTLVFAATAPATGLLFATTGSCPSCGKPRDLVVENVWDNRARVAWKAGSPGAQNGWYVVYGVKGFVPGAGVGDTLFSPLPKLTIAGLQKKTEYDVYVFQDCGDDDFSMLTGPITFETYWSDDVGISALLTPGSSCNLSDDEELIVRLSNYGARPQSLIPITYAINGQPGGVVQPFDGFYTGVLGKDSTEEFTFKTRFDFSAPGEYFIQIWTMMNGDENMSNDTFSVYINNRLTAPYIQRFERWDGGWTVEADAGQASWAHGRPVGAVINSAASGQNAWVTNLTGPYNFQERSYLVSPCFDFEDLDEIPVIECAIFRNMSEFADGAWLEMSDDEGANWNKVGALGEGINWYNIFNSNADLGDVWAGSGTGWEKARIRLLDVAGKTNIRLRFVFQSSNFFVAGEGFGVDDIQIYVPQPNDLAAIQVSISDSECGSATESVTFSFSNFGLNIQDGYQLAYSVNGGPPVIETPADLGAIAPDEIFEYVFQTPFDSRDALSEIRCWTIGLSEQTPANDTLTFVVDRRPNPVPFSEDFESGQIPAGWDVSPGAWVTNTHNNTSFVLAYNLYANAPSFTYTLPRFGVFNVGDSLAFDYRITNWSAGTTPAILAGGTNFQIQISTDCGETYESLGVINAGNHTPTLMYRRRKFDLSPYAGQSAKFRIVGNWQSGDFWFDLDNVQVLSCPESLQLQVSTTPADAGTNGTAAVNAGAGYPPYAYLWSTGATTPSISGLAPGQYAVSVTDSRGCFDEITFEIGTVSTPNIPGLRALALWPNPNDGRCTLNLELEAPSEIRLEAFNLNGQKVWEQQAGQLGTLTTRIDLNTQPPGIYFLRIQADQAATVRRIVVQR